MLVRKWPCGSCGVVDKGTVRNECAVPSACEPQGATHMGRPPRGGVKILLDVRSKMNLGVWTNQRTQLFIRRHVWVGPKCNKGHRAKRWGRGIVVG